MKNALCLSLLIVMAFSFCSFKSLDEMSEELIGVWVHTSFENGISEFTKAEEFKKEAPGFEFKENGKLIKRQNVGWCGTAPITYGNFDGTWQFTSDSTISLSYNYWGGKIYEERLIVELNARSFKTKKSTYKTMRY